MTALVYILAQAPWGPIRFATAASMGEMLRTVTMQPAHIEPCDGIDADRVLEAARAQLPDPDAAGWISARVAEATPRLVEAKRAVLATPIAAMVVDAGPGQDVSQGGAMPASDGRASEPVRSTRQASQAIEPVTLPDIDPAAVRRRTGLTQADFAAAFGLSIGTVRDWERGKNAPDRAARALLAVIERRPDLVREVLASYG